MPLSQIIEKCLKNSQIVLVLTEEGFDWLPKDFTGSTHALQIADSDALHAMARDSDPLTDIDGLAEFIGDNVTQWICDAIDFEQDEPEPNEERIGFLGLLLEKF